MNRTKKMWHGKRKEKRKRVSAREQEKNASLAEEEESAKMEKKTKAREKKRARENSKKRALRKSENSRNGEELREREGKRECACGDISVIPSVLSSKSLFSSLPTSYSVISPDRKKRKRGRPLSAAICRLTVLFGKSCDAYVRNNSAPSTPETKSADTSRQSSEMRE